MFVDIYKRQETVSREVFTDIFEGRKSEDRKTEGVYGISCKIKLSRFNEMLRHVVGMECVSINKINYISYNLSMSMVTGLKENLVKNNFFSKFLQKKSMYYKTGNFGRVSSCYSLVGAAFKYS